MPVKRLTERPWGVFETLAEAKGWKIKEITVNPGCRLSLQSHERREEHWIVTQGEGLVTIGQDVLVATPGNYFFIPKGGVHRLQCTGSTDLKMIEVQRGDYLGEDDINRIEDDYDRAQ